MRGLILFLLLQESAIGMPSLKTLLAGNKKQRLYRRFFTEEVQEIEGVASSNELSLDDVNKVLRGA